MKNAIAIFTYYRLCRFFADCAVKSKKTPTAVEGLFLLEKG